MFEQNNSPVYSIRVNNIWISFMLIPILWVICDVMNSLKCMPVLCFYLWVYSLVAHLVTPAPLPLPLAQWKRATRNSIHMCGITWAIVQNIQATCAKWCEAKANYSLFSFLFALRGDMCHVKSWDGSLCTLGPRSQTVAQVLDLDCYLSWCD